MPRLALRALALLAALALAGCSGGDSDDGATTRSSASSGSAGAAANGTSQSSSSGAPSSASSSSSNATASGPANATTAPPAPIQVVDASFAVGGEGCVSWAVYDGLGLDPLAPAGATLNGLTRVQFTVDALTIGRTYTANFTFDQGYLFVNVAFYDAGEALLSSDATDTQNFGGVTLMGTVPEGAAKAGLFTCAGPTVQTVHYEA